jgi:D-threo-aldose 1-dehydrogenase
VTPNPVRPVFDYSYDGVMRSYAESLERLGRSRIDILLAHDLGAATHKDRHEHYFRQFFGGGYRAMRELRDSGAVRAIGLGVNEWEVCEQVLDHGDFDCFLLAGRYTLLEQTALDSFLPRCAARGVSLVIGGPYNSGILATGVKGRGPLYYNYEPAPPDIIERVRRIETVCDRFAVPLAAAAMQFPLAHPQVAAVIPGMVNAAEAEAAKANLECAIPPDFWTALRQDGLLHPDAPAP